MLIFLILASYNIGNYLVGVRYNEASSINNDIEEVMELVKDNNDVYSKLDAINSDVRFLNAFCLGEELYE